MHMVIKIKILYNYMCIQCLINLINIFSSINKYDNKKNITAYRNRLFAIISFIRENLIQHKWAPSILYLTRISLLCNSTRSAVASEIESTRRPKSLSTFERIQSPVWASHRAYNTILIYLSLGSVVLPRACVCVCMHMRMRMRIYARLLPERECVALRDWKQNIGNATLQ